MGAGSIRWQCYIPLLGVQSPGYGCHPAEPIGLSIPLGCTYPCLVCSLGTDVILRNQFLCSLPMCFRGDTVRTPEGRLLPAPSILLNPMRMAEKLKKGGANASSFEIR